jgi:hypothetical protein
MVEHANTVLEGFTITDGNTNYYGGGILFNKGSPTVNNYTFSGNSAK